MRKKLTVFSFTTNGAALGQRLKKGLSESGFDVFHATRSRIRRSSLERFVARAFDERRGLLFISAAGIAVRAVAPFLKGKDKDPPVVIVDEAGGFAVSLVSGHLGGANELARVAAQIVGATPVITTATDVRGLPCLEDLAEGFSLAIDDVKKIKLVNSAILDGEPVVVVDRVRERLAHMKQRYGGGGVFRFRSTRPATVGSTNPVVIISPFTNKASPGRGATVFLRPVEFVIGMGFKKGVGAGELESTYKRFLKKAAVSPLAVRNLATIDAKRGGPALEAFVKSVGLRVEFLSTRELTLRRPPSGPSAKAVEVFGVAGVSEPAALISSGAKRIWIKKQKKGMVTLAAARAPYLS